MFLFFSLGDVLLEKESIGLPEIVEVLGDRPYGMNEVMTEYLSEMRQRRKDDAVEEAEAAKTKLEDELEEKSEDEEEKSEDKSDEKIKDEKNKDK
jgi:hypothetical protein